MFKIARKYTILQHLRYLSNYSRVSVYVQADLQNLPDLWDISPFYIREMNFDQKKDIIEWVEVVNDSYEEFGEKKIELSEADNYLKKHPIMHIDSVFFIMKDDKPIGAISVGRYRNNDNIGCVSRIAISEKYKGQKLGKYIITYAYRKLLEKGIKYGQSIICIRRTASIFSHFSCGFVPQLNRKYVIYNNQKRFVFIRILVYLRIRKMYKKYLLKLSEHFLQSMQV